MPAEHSTSLDRESAAPTAPMGTECLLLAHGTAPVDAFVGFADSSKRLCSGIVSLLAAVCASAFSSHKLSLFCYVSIRTPRLWSRGNPSAGNNVIKALQLQRQAQKMCDLNSKIVLISLECSV